MSIIQINKRTPPTQTFALFNLGLRPFFLGAAAFTIISITLWSLVYFSHITLALASFSAFRWHALEMIYGYWIFLSQLAWLIAFSLFLISYSNMLFQPRIDGQVG